MESRDLEERAVRLLVFDEYEIGHAVEVTFSARAAIGPLVRSLLQHVGITGDEGTHVLVDVRSKASFAADAPLFECQLIHGQKLWLAPFSQAPTRPMPLLRESDIVRLTTELGPQISLAWPLSESLPEIRFLVDRETGALMEAGTTEADFIVRLDADEETLTVSTRRKLLRIDGIVLDTEIETVTLGSAIEVMNQVGDEALTLLRVASSNDHEKRYRLTPVIPYRVVPSSHAPEIGPPLTTKLAPVPGGKVEPVALAEFFLQQAPMALMPLLFIFAVGLKPYLFAFILVPFSYLAYSYYRKAKEKEKASRAVDEWRRSMTSELGVLHRRALDEADLLRSQHPETYALAALALRGGPGLWRGDSVEATRMKVAVGHGTYQTGSTAELPGDQTDGNLQDWRAYIESLRLVEDTPNVVDLSVENIALVGSGALVAEAAAEVLVRLSLTHSPKALAFAALLPEIGKDLERLAWMKWLPHFSVATELFSSHRFVRGASAGNAALRLAIESASARGEGRLLLFVHEAAGVEVHLLESLLGAAVGRVCIVWYGVAASRVPDFVSCVVKVRPESSDLEIEADALPRSDTLVIPRWSEDTLTLWASSIAALVDETGTGVSAAIPQSVALSAILTVDPTRIAESISEAWERETTAASMIATLGATAAGPFDFDLCEHGPHALIGGTTGSGKSEFLRTLVLSLICRYSPLELSLLLIDFKGGAALSDFSDVPHQVGVVSNLEASDVQRVVEFLREEINRRQRILRKYQGEYVRYREEKAKESANRQRIENLLPRLVVVIDEFAGFASSGKDNIEAIVNVAARGRSLGVHLVLATQRPGSGIPKEVTANVDARFCLRTLDEADSLAVLDSVDAAKITKSLPGRAFARLTAGGLVELQTAWTQASSFMQRASAPDLRLHPYEPVVPFKRTSALALESGKKDKDFDLITKAVADLQAPWGVSIDARSRNADGVSSALRADQPVLQPALGSDVSFDGVPSEGKPLTVIAGLRDEPQHQRQSGEVIDLTAGSVLMSGGTLSGRTELLQSVAAQFSNKNPRGRLVVIDAADGRLARLLGDRCAFVAHHPSRGMLEYLFEQLQLPEFRESEEPVLVLIDRLDVIAGTPAEAERVASLVVNGPITRIYFAATVDDRASLEPMLLRAFHWRYRAYGRSAGRVINANDDVIQLYRAPAPSGLQAHNGERPIGMPPPELRSNIPQARSGHVYLGIDELRHAHVDVFLRRGLSIVGPEESGKTTTLLTLGERLAELLGRPLPLIASVETNDAHYIDVTREVLPIVPGQMNIWLEKYAALWWREGQSNFLLVDDAQDLWQYFASPDGLSYFPAPINEILRRWRVRLIATGRLDMLNSVGVDIQDIPRFDERSFIVLQPVSASQVERFGFALHWEAVVKPRLWRQYEPGEGVLVSGRNRYDVKVQSTASARELAAFARKELNDF